MSKPNTSKKPFFARFLEGQDFPRVKTDLRAGATTSPKKDLEQTQKYPSDGDEI